MNKLFPLLNPISFYITISGIVISFILAWLKEKNKLSDKYKKWIYVPLIFSFIAVLSNKYVNDENSNLNNSKIEKLINRANKFEVENKELEKSFNVLDSTNKKETKLLKDTLHLTKQEIKEIKEPRKLTEIEKEKFIRFFSDKIKLDILLYRVPDDDEAVSFMLQLKSLFISAGFKCTDNGMYSGIHPSDGIVVFAPNKKFIPAILMQDALNKINKLNTGLIKDKLSFNSLTIFIGHKPKINSN